MSEKPTSIWLSRIQKNGSNLADLWRKIWLIGLGGISLVFNMFLLPRVTLLYSETGVPFNSQNTIISYIAIIALFILAFIPLGKDFAKNFIAFAFLGLVLWFVSIFSIISAVYTLTSVL